MRKLQFIFIVFTLSILLSGYTYKGAFVPLNERRVDKSHYREEKYGSREYVKAYMEYEKARTRKHPSQSELKTKELYYYNRGYRWKDYQYKMDHPNTVYYPRKKK